MVCGALGVPLDRTGATPGSITVRFRLYKHTDASKPPLETIVAAEGGPGYSTLGSADSYLELFAPLRARHDVLVVDQRGTGSSHVIKCAPAQSYVGDAVENARLCGEQLGDRADLFTSAAAADDLAAVLDSLGVAKIDLYGDSYGSFFAQTFTVRHPDRVRALVLDGTYPASHLDPWYPTTARLAAAQLPRRVPAQRRHLPGRAVADDCAAGPAAGQGARAPDHRDGARCQRP